MRTTGAIHPRRLWVLTAPGDTPYDQPCHHLCACVAMSPCGDAVSCRVNPMTAALRTWWNPAGVALPSAPSAPEAGPFHDARCADRLARQEASGPSPVASRERTTAWRWTLAAAP